MFTESDNAEVEGEKKKKHQTFIKKQRGKIILCKVCVPFFSSVNGSHL